MLPEVVVLIVISVIGLLTLILMPDTVCTTATSLPELIDALLNDPDECHQEVKSVIRSTCRYALVIFAVVISYQIKNFIGQTNVRKGKKSKTSSSTTSGQRFAKNVPTAQKYFPESSRNATKLSIHTVHVITSIEACSDFIRQIMRHCRDFPVLGIDCKLFKGKVQLLQLASGRGLCVIIRLGQMTNIPKELGTLLRDERILKVGIDSSNGWAKLEKNHGLQLESTLDLRHLAYRLNIPGPYEMANLADHVLGMDMDKNWKTSTFNWENKELTASQTVYASRDAIAALEVFRVFDKQIDDDMDTYYNLPFKQ